jgi:hypothetical protein
VLLNVTDVDVAPAIDDAAAQAGRLCYRSRAAGHVTAHGRSADVRHLDFPVCGDVVVRPRPPGQAPPMPFDNGGTAEALEAAHDVALPAVARHPRGGAR